MNYSDNNPTFTHLKPRSPDRSFFGILTFLMLLVAAGCESAGESDRTETSAEILCDPDNGGLTLPDGFCASVIADNIGPARHLAVASNGDIYLKTRGQEGGVAALRDTTGDYRIDVVEYFSNMTPVRGGILWETGMEIHDGYLWVSNTESVYRWPMPEYEELIPQGEPEIMISGFLSQSDHASKTFTFDNNGHIYVAVGAPSNNCQEEPRTPGSPGQEPCQQLELQGGVWRFSDSTPGQTQQEDGVRYSTGIRNMVGIDWNHDTGALYVMQHGRDQLDQLWPELFTEQQNADLPAEELLRLEQDANAGWPYCYYDWQQGHRVLAPEYGGDGQETGGCADYLEPEVAFPGHWAPNDLLFYTGDQFPEHYQKGAFIAFHGSWNRGTLNQQGYNVTFVPYQEGSPSGDYEIFADGFAGVDPIASPGDAAHRPMGLATGPDGALYISDSVQGRIWRIIYIGEEE